MHLGIWRIPKPVCAKNVCFSNFDTANTGKISKEMFVQILKTKEVPEKDIQEMLDGNSSCGLKSYTFFIVNNVTAYKNVNPPDVEEGDEENINYIGQNYITHWVTQFIFQFQNL